MQESVPGTIDFRSFENFGSLLRMQESAAGVAFEIPAYAAMTRKKSFLHSLLHWNDWEKYLINRLLGGWNIVEGSS